MDFCKIIAVCKKSLSLYFLKLYFKYLSLLIVSSIPYLYLLYIVYLIDLSAIP